MNLTVEAAWYGVTPVRARGRVDGRVKLACLLAVLVTLTPVRTGWPDNPPAVLLAEADRLAWLHNWVRARPLFERAERLFIQAGDARNALYCKVSRLRADVQSMSFIEVAGDLAKEFENPIVQNDLELKLRLLVVKGNINLEIDPPESPRDLEQVLSIAEKLGKKQWAARAGRGFDHHHVAVQNAGALHGISTHLEAGAAVFGPKAEAAHVHGDTALGRRGRVSAETD